MKSWLQDKRAQGALETVFKIFILLVVVGVVVALFLSAIGKLDDILGGGKSGTVTLIEAKTQCDSKCTGNSADWAEYCLRNFRIDFDNDRKVASEYGGSEVFGIGVCETNVKCYNIYRCELPSGQVLNAPRCAQELATYYSGVTDDEVFISRKVSQSLEAGTCGEAGAPPEAYCLAFQNDPEFGLACAPPEPPI